MTAPSGSYTFAGRVSQAEVLHLLANARAYIVSPAAAVYTAE